jgi:hypothetical protein
MVIKQKTKPQNAKTKKQKKKRLCINIIYLYNIYMFLTLEKFLSYFPKKNITKEEFSNKLKIMYKTSYTLDELFSLKHKTVIKDKTDIRYIRRNEIIDYFYDIIIDNRHKYLSLWYNSHFKFINPKDLKWDNISLELKSPTNERIISTQKNDNSKHMIRSLFYLELFDYTKITNTVKNHVSFWNSLLNMYNKLELEDRFFAKSSIELLLKDKNTLREKSSGIKERNYNILFYLYQQYQPKASIFNPYTIKYILTDIILPLSGSQNKKDMKLLSPVLSWGSYLPAFMHSDNYSHYVGIDVMKSVCDKVKKFGIWYNNELNTNKKIDIVCSPSEKLNNTKFTTKYNNYFDTIIICPPYYDMEIYHEGPQSIKSYKSYDEWLEKYWGGTIELCHKVSKTNTIFAVIANNYFSLDKKMFPLVQDFHKITSKYFTLIDTIYLQNRTSPLRVNNKDRMERLLIYKSKN